jgi:hypothetical protein
MCVCVFACVCVHASMCVVIVGCYEWEDGEVENAIFANFVMSAAL